MNQKELNTFKLRDYFESLLDSENVEGIIGVANFNEVFMSLIPNQKKRTEEICNNDFHSYLKEGYFISIGVAYPLSAILHIDNDSDSNIRIAKWNEYAKEYSRLNKLLDDMTDKISKEFKGIAIPATLSGFTKEVSHVTDYFPFTISHRAIAEHAGLGWRGKNGLIINERFSCALRFASVITDLPLIPNSKVERDCGSCTACEDVCSFIRNRAALKDYRENCRRYIIYLQNLGLNEEVCGKCIKACYMDSIFSNQFNLKNSKDDEVNGV